MGWYNKELYHHGIKGQRWGVRRFQNKDGSLTSAGKQRYDAYNESERLKSNVSSANNKLNAAGEKLINSSSNLKKGFGSMKNVDDIEYLYLQAANGKASKEFKEFDKAYDDYLSAKKQSRVFDKENAKAIKEGEKIVNSLLKGTDNSYGKNVIKEMQEYSKKGDYDSVRRIATEAARSGKLRNIDSVLEDKQLNDSIRNSLKQTKSLIDKQSQLKDAVDVAYEKLEKGTGSAKEYNDAVKNMQDSQDRIQESFENSLKKAGYNVDGFGYDSNGKLSVRAAKYNMDELFETNGYPTDEAHIIISSKGDVNMDDDYS